MLIEDAIGRTSTWMYIVFTIAGSIQISVLATTTLPRFNDGNVKRPRKFFAKKKTLPDATQLPLITEFFDQFVRHI